uniref:Uncharacterized protein n=1 Tax=Cuerna arida TaxID=1464854 RepID=A0A1B6EY25_9HEMI
MSIKAFWKCMFSPKLFKVYTGRNNEGLYEAGHLESWGDQVITSLYIMGNVAMYSSPVLTYLLFRKGYFVSEGLVTLTKFGVGIIIVLVTSYCLRSYGRMTTPVYLEFQRVLEEAQKSLNRTTKQRLAQYDFEFKAWPVEFQWSDVEGEGDKRRSGDVPGRRSTDKGVFYAPCTILSYLAAHTFGIRLIYPGAIAALSFMMSPVLLQGRMKLVEKDEGERYKLKTRDNNEIDAMFVDRRRKGGNGSTLVICSEGNAGFYEIGIMTTPLKCNYSVLGWNHPGFAGSTGMPYPEQEQNAVDIVIQFAIGRLGFQPENIILFGWSIGGYVTSWAANTYPDIKAVMIDASFDDLLPLAIPRMPAALEPLVRRTIRYYVNLDVAAQLCQYPGPVRLFRRTEDEVICLIPGVLRTNRGNHLLAQLLRYRYPNLFCNESEDALFLWLEKAGSHQASVFNKYDVNEVICKSTVTAFMERQEAPMFPSSFGATMDHSQKCQMLLYIASTYLTDFASTHCTPLPPNLFFVPQLISTT